MYVNPLKIFNSIWPDKMFAARRKPNETFLAKYDINSINTNKGNNPNGQPDGTNNEKNLLLWYINPNIVAPNTIVKLNENVNTKWLVEAKLYGTIPIKLLHNINKRCQKCQILICDYGRSRQYLHKDYRKTDYTYKSTWEIVYENKTIEILSHAFN